MVGEDQVLPPAVDVERLPQIGHGHTAALDVPAGPAGAPRTVPRGLSGPGLFPQGEVHGVLFVFVHLYPGAGLHPFQGAVTQLAVLGAALDLEINVTPCRVGVAAVDQRVDGFQNGADLLGGPGVDVGPLDVQGIHAAVKVINVLFGKVQSVYAPFLGPLDNLVVDVSEILDVPDVVPQVFQEPAQYVKGHVAKGVAHVSRRVGSHPADVHLDGVAVGGDELGNLSGQGVV